MPHPLPAWQQLGHLLSRRRVELDPRWKSRVQFAEDTGLNERLISDIENARRTGYRRTSITAIEGAYRLAEGSLEEILQNPQATEFPRRTGDSNATASTGSATDSFTVHTTEEPEPTCPPGGYSDGPLGATERIIWEYNRDRPWQARLHAIRVLRDGPDPIRTRDNNGQQNGSRREA